jgi:valyl-tRNA synthetase
MYNKEQDPESANAALWTLKKVLSDALKMLHPYMPFITEEIYCTLHPEEESIMISSWPEFDEKYDFSEEEEMIERAKELVKGIRNVRKDMDVPNSKKAKVIITSDKESVLKNFEKTKDAYQTLANASEVEFQDASAEVPEDAVSVVIADAVVYLPLADLVDMEKEKERLTKEKEKLEKELQRSRGMLSNERFLSKAPEAKVQEEKEKLAKYEQMMKDVCDRLDAMK